MTEYTPGPWVVDPDDRPGMEYNIHVVSRCGLICFMAHSGKADNSEFEANAHLISAAPEMYKALLEVRHHANDECGFMVNVTAALAKAEGKDND